MSALTRQNTLLVAESWTRIYEALENQDFRAYDFSNIVQAIFNYLKSSYPEEYNDWVSSSEFVTKVEILAWLSQNLAFRTELNSRENFITTAERRDSIIRLAQNVGYKMNRVRSATGALKLKTIRTTEDIIDSNGINIKNKTVTWNDPRDPDWFERFILILNQSFTNRTKFGSPLSTNTTNGITTAQYRFNSAAPLSGSYNFTSTVNGNTLPFDLYNAKVNSSNGNIDEYAPSLANAFHIIYRLDGNGFSSNETGFFLPFKQGSLAFQDEFFTNPEVLRTVTLPASNVNNNDFFVQQLDGVGNVIADWTQVDTTFGEGVSFNTLSGSVQNVYEIDTLVDDKVRIKFGDGTFGAIPVGSFRLWYRTADPIPTQINPSSIQNHALTIPYTSGNNLYQITMTASLNTTVSNGVSTESNFDIRTRVGKVFYTQNRMVNAQDYNNFFLKDNSIQKVQTVNRSFVGQSRYSKLTDPTGLYQNTKHVATDGRLYIDETKNINSYSGNTATLSIAALISQYVKPLIQKIDKKTLYQTVYGEIILPTTYRWTETSQIAAQSRGNITVSGVAQAVGNNATGDLKYIDTGSIMRLTDPLGATVNIDRVIGAGTASDGVILKDVIANGATMYSVLPALRNAFTATEENELISRITSKLDFGIYWDQVNQSWKFISSEDLNRTGAFSLSKMGDVSKTGIDASWMIMFVFSAGNSTSTTDDQWTITDRGQSLFFESAKEVDFVFQNSTPVIDPETGKSVWDTISVLATNESKDSLNRRGIDGVTYNTAGLSVYTFVGDGTTKIFQTQQVPMVSSKTIVQLGGVYQIENSDYTITASNAGYSISFTVAPAIGVPINVYYDSNFVQANQSITVANGNGVIDEFDLGVSGVRPRNVISYIDGVAQHTSLDFGIGQMGNNNSLLYDWVLPTNVVGTIFTISGIDNEVFTKTNFVGNGSTVTYIIPDANQSSNTVLIALDGVTQAPSQFTVTGGSTSSTVTFTTAPSANVHVRMTSVTNVNMVRTHQYEFTPDGLTNTFTLTNATTIPSSADGVIVTMNGILQYGPWSANPVWSITGSNQIFFPTAPSSNVVIQVFHISGASGVKSVTDPSAIPLATNGTPLNVSSYLINFIGQSVSFTPRDVIRHADGYINKNGLVVEPIDANLDGAIDQPFIFRDLVYLDGSDLVLWRSIEEFGFTVWEPIGSSTVPRGTYGNSVAGGITVGDVINTTISATGDIHFDRATNVWLLADSITGKWIAAPTQSLYKSRIGRGDLRFLWTHYAPEANRIDPSKSNIMNVYILSSGYNTAYRNWLAQNGIAADEPIPETSAQLKITYANFEEFKPISDAIIYYPMQYVPLFGKQAIPEYRAIFKIIQTTGSSLSESDLKLKVLAAIDKYFEIGRWSAGEKFYYTELVAFVHATVAPDLQSMVIVPTTTNQAFGRMFQIRTEQNQLFISAASPEDITVVNFFSDRELRVGTLV